MYAANSSFNVGRHPFSIQRGANTQVEWTTAVCRLFIHRSNCFEVGVISRDAPTSACARVNYKKTCTFRILDCEVLDTLGLILKSFTQA